MARIKAGFVSGTLSNDLGSSGTTMNSAGLANLPIVASPDIAVIILDPQGVSGTPEIVWVTAHSSGSTAATILRAQENTTSRQHLTNTPWVHGPTITDFHETHAHGSDKHTADYAADPHGDAAHSQVYANSPHDNGSHSVNYSAETHDHDAVYSPLGHGHDTGPHDHDGTYAPTLHGHNDHVDVYATLAELNAHSNSGHEGPTKELFIPVASLHRASTSWSWERPRNKARDQIAMTTLLEDDFLYFEPFRTPGDFNTYLSIGAVVIGAVAGTINYSAQATRLQIGSAVFTHTSMTGSRSIGGGSGDFLDLAGAIPSDVANRYYGIRLTNTGSVAIDVVGLLFVYS